MKSRVCFRRELSRTQENRGAVLLVVLWVMVGMSLLALSFSVAIRTEVDAARNVVDQKQSYYMARAGIEYATYKIIESQMGEFQQQGVKGFESIPPVFTGWLRLPLGQGSAEVEIIDETGKINVNLAPSHLLYNLFLFVGLDGQQADVITDSIDDWRDPDDLYRHNGAESDYYQSAPEPYWPKNGLLDVPEELLLIRGITPEIYYGRKGVTEAGERVEFYGLQKYLTTFSHVNRINVNSAAIPVLAAIPGLDYDTAVRIYSMRQQAPFKDVGDIMKSIPGMATNVGSYLSTDRSNIFSLISTGSLGHSRVVSRIRSVVQVGGTGQKGYSILYWNESNIEL